MFKCIRKLSHFSFYEVVSTFLARRRAQCSCVAALYSLPSSYIRALLKSVYRIRDFKLDAKIASFILFLCFLKSFHEFVVHIQVGGAGARILCIKSDLISCCGLGVKTDITYFSQSVILMLAFTSRHQYQPFAFLPIDVG